MKESILIISDVHLRQHIADQILELEKQNYTKVLCGGDVFDDFNDTPEENARAAEWFVEKINDPKWVMLRSNHSISYEFAWNQNTYCSGFTKEKAAIINRIVGRDDWNKQKTFHYENSFLFTHAGLSKNFLDMMVKQGYAEAFDYTIENIIKHLTEWEQKGLDYCSMGHMHPIFGAGWDRGGNQPYGSPIWIDFSSLANIQGIKQILFHTPHPFPDFKYVRNDGRNIMQDVMSPILKKTKVKFENGVAYNLDTNSSHYAILADNTLSIYEIVFDKPRKETRKGEHKVAGKNLIYAKTFN
jgi:hypothetical protein